jgi:hypothetical protein
MSTLDNTALSGQHLALDELAARLTEALHLRLDLNQHAMHSNNITSYTDALEQSIQLIQLLLGEITRFITPHPVHSLLASRAAERELQHRFCGLRLAQIIDGMRLLDLKAALAEMNGGAE